MSSRASRVDESSQVGRFAWGAAPGADAVPFPTPPNEAEPAAVAAPDLTSLEREAFAKGYAQGERAGAEAAAARADAVLRRLASTIDELQGLRRELVQRAERDVAQLAMAIARRIVMRELALDQDLLLTMARVALDRLADVATASIRLHPDDYAGVMATRGGGAAASAGVQIVADPGVRRGGCVVQSEFGSVDVGAAAQIDELTHALFGDETTAPSRPVGLRDDAAA